MPSTIKSKVREAAIYVIMEYSATSTLNRYAAARNMITLMVTIISPIVVPNFLLKKMANTSEPSMTAPPRMAKPIPAPRKNPPKTAISKLSSVHLETSL